MYVWTHAEVKLYIIYLLRQFISKPAIYEHLAYKTAVHDQSLGHVREISPTL